MVNSCKEDIAYELRNELINNNHTRFYSYNAWLNFEKNNYGNVFPMKGGDLCVQIFRSDFAELMFPTWIHGSGSLCGMRNLSLIFYSLISQFI